MAFLGKKRGTEFRITGGILCSKELKAKPMGYIRGDSKISGFHGPPTAAWQGERGLNWEWPLVT